MKFRTLGSIAPALFALLLTVFACDLGVARPLTPPTPRPLPLGTITFPTVTATANNELATELAPSPTSAVVHHMAPAEVPALGKLVYDVQSRDTAPQKRAPYGDSYAINRLERPFLQDMTYVPNLDISTFKVGRDKDWYYVTIKLVGTEPNDKLGIDYAVELDRNYDGFGEYILWAQPPYPAVWDTAPVHIFQDTNHDTGGLSAERSDAPLPAANGYDTLIFNGGVGDADPDIAWVRANVGVKGSVQFAFKRSWSRDIFMLGVLADASLKDPKKLDYVDRLTLAQAGSPVRNNSEYPLKALYAVDNSCREAFGLNPTGYEPQLCPRTGPRPTKEPKPTGTPEG